MNVSNRGLSKTTFKQGLRCPRALWLEFNHPELKDEKFGEPTSIEFGHEVGELARTYFPGTILADMSDADDPHRIKKAAEKTKQLLNEGVECIAEATFVIEGGHKCQVDLLKKVGVQEGLYDLYEVKSSTKVKPEHLDDVTFQVWVLQQAKIQVNKVYLMHVNAEYKREENLDVEEYFFHTDVTEEAKEKVSKLDNDSKIHELIELTQRIDEPVEIIPERQCDRPKCPFFGHCVPEANDPNSVIWLARMSRKKACELIRSGCDTKADLLALCDSKTSAHNIAECTGTSHIMHNELLTWLTQLENKELYFLDFETVQQAVPEFVGDTPFVQVPTQFSLHVVKPTGGTWKVEHKEYLAEGDGSNPWRGIAEALTKAIPMGSITIAYFKAFERERIKAMAEKFPDLSAHLLDIVRGEGEERKRRPKTDISGLGLIDLIDPFKQTWVWLPAMQASCSIKVTLPALFPDDSSLNYHNLLNHGFESPNVRNGAMAIVAYKAMRSMDETTRLATRENLLRYCELDTWAMVKIWLKLREIAGFKPLSGLPVEATLDVVQTC